MVIDCVSGRRGRTTGKVTRRFPHGRPARPGVLLVNLGTPEAPTPQALRKSLPQFLGDPRVIELPRWQWRAILHGIVLRTRPQRVAKGYAGVWTDEGSPLILTTESLAESLRDRVEGPGLFSRFDFQHEKDDRHHRDTGRPAEDAACDPVHASSPRVSIHLHQHRSRHKTRFASDSATVL